MAKMHLLPRKDMARLSQDEARQDIEALRREIRRHDELYYVMNRPEIADEEYDRLFETLKQLEQAFPERITPDSPTQRAGAEPRQGFPVVQHIAPMLSLDATRQAAEVRRFEARVRQALGNQVQYVLEEKFDGLSVELVYRDGVLERAATRGDGRQGEGVSESVKTIRAVPLRLHADARAVPPFLALRGEVIMPLSAFEALNRQLLEAGNEPFANPRNAAAGSLRQLDPRITAARRLDCIAYEIVAAAGQKFKTDTEALNALRAWGLRVPETIATATTTADIMQHYAHWSEERDRLAYQIDGIVIKVDDLDAREHLGATTHHPRWAMAYKFEPRREVTRVEDIVVQVGRTGVLTPVALLRPVEIGGVTVSRASLHNPMEVQRKNVRVGDLVRIQRAGDVIPEVVERLEEPGHKRQAPFAMPSQCPSCGTKVIQRGPYALCPNQAGCRAQLKRRIEHFVAPEGLNIDHLGAETVSALVDRGVVRELADLFALKVDDLLRLESFAERSARQLLEAIQNGKRVELQRFLYALGIPEVGTAAARDLADHFHRLAAVRYASRQELAEVPGIGPKMSQAIHDFFADARHQRTIDALLKMGMQILAPRVPTEQPLRGKTFVFTGALDRFARSAARKRVESLGARATSAVSHETDYVVVGKEPGQKLHAAREQGVTMLTESQFVALLREAGAAV